LEKIGIEQTWKKYCGGKAQEDVSRGAMAFFRSRMKHRWGAEKAVCIGKWGGGEGVDSGATNEGKRREEDKVVGNIEVNQVTI